MGGEVIIIIFLMIISFEELKSVLYKTKFRDDAICNLIAKDTMWLNAMMQTYIHMWETRVVLPSGQINVSVQFMKMTFDWEAKTITHHDKHNHRLTRQMIRFCNYHTILWDECQVIQDSLHQCAMIHFTRSYRRLIASRDHKEEIYVESSVAMKPF